MHLLILSEDKRAVDEAALAARSVRVTALSGTLATALDQVVAANPDMALVDCAGEDAEVLRQLTRLQDLLPACIVVPMRPDPAPDFLVQLIHMGVPDVLTDAATPITVALVDRIAQRPARQGGAARRTVQCLGVMSVKGGSGATLLGSNLALALARRVPGRRVLLIDAALPFGDADIYLNAARGDHHLGHFHDSIERLDAALFGAMVRKLSPNLDFIPAPPTFREVVSLEPERIATLIGKAKALYDFVLIDISSVINPFTAAILEHLTRLYLVANADIIGVQHAAQMVRFLEDIAFADDAVRLCINRWDSGGLVTVKDLTAATGRDVAHVVPQAQALVAKAMAQGRPVLDLAPASPFAEAVEQWVSEMGGDPQQGKSLWKRLRGR